MAFIIKSQSYSVGYWVTFPILGSLYARLKAPILDKILISNVGVLIMEKKIDYNEIIHRIGYFRTKANLSARETSLRLGYSEQFMKRIENKSVELKVSTLLEFFDVVDITPQDFFYMGDHYNKEDKNVLDLFNNLSQDGKQTILDLMKKLK